MANSFLGLRSTEGLSLEDRSTYKQSPPLRHLQFVAVAPGVEQRQDRRFCEITIDSYSKTFKKYQFPFGLLRFERGYFL
jgi:hypothetical protein